MASNSSTLATINTAYKGRTGHPTWGESAANGNGSTTAFNIAHGFGAAPANFWAVPLSEVSTAKRTVTANGTNIIVTFTAAPPAGTGNVKFRWGVSR